jgi:hypothetical protein
MFIVKECARLYGNTAKHVEVQQSYSVASVVSSSGSLLHDTRCVSIYSMHATHKKSHKGLLDAVADGSTTL